MRTLLDLAATQLVATTPHSTRRACWLARSAMEDALDALLRAKGLEVGAASARAKLSCLEVAYADQPGLVSRAQYVWTQLSEACHQHAYQLSPTHHEAVHLVEIVRELIELTPDA